MPRHVTTATLTILLGAIASTAAFADQSLPLADCYAHRSAMLKLGPTFCDNLQLLAGSGTKATAAEQTPTPPEPTLPLVRTKVRSVLTSSAASRAL